MSRTSESRPRARPRDQATTAVDPKKFPLDAEWREQGARWRATVQLDLDRPHGHARVVVRAVTIEATGGHLSGAMLREVPIALIETSANTNTARARLARHRPGKPLILRPPPVLVEGPPAWSATGVFPVLHHEVLVAGPRATPDFYGYVAEAYRELLARGERRPTAAIAQAADASPSTAAAWVRRARERGHLPPARHGVAG